MMAVWWTFRSYHTDRGDRIFEDWHDTRPDKFQAKIDTRLRYLRQQPLSKWNRPYAAVLHGDCAGLWEIILESMNVQWRPLGFISADMEFTFLFIAQERDDKWEPRNACESAQRRKAEVIANRNKAHDCEFE
jgi:hypothetical protein